MERLIFVNLQVRDLAVARSFYAGLGFRVSEQVSDDDVVCVVVSHAICLMLLPRGRWAGVGHGPADAGAVALLGLSATSRAEVDALADAAVRGGGGELRAPQDDGSVYARAVHDPDGHVWEILHTDPGAPC